MPDDPNLQDRLFELIYGLLPDEEADDLRAEIEKDKAGRRRLYEELGLPADNSVR